MSDPLVAMGATGALRAFAEAGILAPADVHVARRLGRLVGDTHDDVLLAAALAVRAPRLGSVFADLATIAATVAVEQEGVGDPALLDWPDAGAWTERVSRSPLVALGEDGADERPLRLLGSRLYLDRYWREERQVAADLLALAATPAPQVDAAAVAAGLDRLGGAGDADLRQREAVIAATTRRLVVVAGGPGTGKTTTIARVVALLHEHAAADGRPAPLIAAAAPTGKAAARLEESLHAAAAGLTLGEGIEERLLATRATTLHRLLGWRPDSHSRFKHHRANRLPHDVVIVDETSMVGLSLMARLVEAVRPDARLVLVGDPGQLTSIEAGAVLGDVVGPALTGEAPDTPLARGIVILDSGHRFGGAIHDVAAAVRDGVADVAVQRLAAPPDDSIVWIDADPAEDRSDGLLAEVRAAAVAAGAAMTDAAHAGDARAALAALGSFRLLCAHRRGPHGVRAWTEVSEAWLEASVPRFGEGGRDYLGRPVLVTANDPETGLYNGDTGVIIADAGGRPRAAFERRGEVVTISPQRLAAAETVHAMTIHKSQGSQFETAAVLLPAAGSRILTRELLYTAITRARSRLIVVGAEATIREAIGRPVSRSTGLRERLWGA